MYLVAYEERAKLSTYTGKNGQIEADRQIDK